MNKKEKQASNSSSDKKDPKLKLSEKELKLPSFVIYTPLVPPYGCGSAGSNKLSGAFKAFDGSDDDDELEFDEFDD